MNEQMLNLIKEEIQKEKERQIQYRKIFERISSLEKNELVIEYLELINMLQDFNYYQNDEEIEDKVIDSIISKYGDEIFDTNGIIVYLGTYVSVDSQFGDNDILVSRDDRAANYRVYADLEKRLSDSILVSIDQCEEFELNNNVVILGPYVPDRDFYLLQRYFIKEIIKSNKKEAYNKVVMKRKLNK